MAHYRECDGALLFSVEELVNSPASQINFLDQIDPADYFESSDNGELTGDEYLSHIEAADVSENSEDMPALVDVLDSSKTRVRRYLVQISIPMVKITKLTFMKTYQSLRKFLTPRMMKIAIRRIFTIPQMTFQTSWTKQVKF